MQYEPETSLALGFGFRCGFLGLLHLEIIQERLEREFNLDLVTTAPGVIYKVHKTNGEVMDLTNPSNLPDPSEIEYMEEPVVSAEIMVTSEYVGAIMKLCQERRGVYLSMEYLEAVSYTHLGRKFYQKQTKEAFPVCDFGYIDTANKTEVRGEGGKTGIFYLALGDAGLYKLCYDTKTEEIHVKRLTDTGDACYRMGPVSYTHLDVYKRQPTNCTACLHLWWRQAASMR